MLLFAKSVPKVLLFQSQRTIRKEENLFSRYLACVATEYGMLENISQWARYEEVVIDNNIIDAANTLYTDILTYLSRYLP